MSESEIGIILEALQEVRKEVKESVREIVELKTTVRDYNGLREKLANACSLGKQNRSDIDKMLDNNKWLFRTLAGLIIAYVIGIVVLFVQQVPK